MITLGLHWQFGVVQNAVSAAVAAPQDVRIADDDGTINSITISANQAFSHDSASISSGTDRDIAHNDDVFILQGTATTFTVGAYGGTQTGGGAITTHSWTLSVDSDTAGIVDALSNTTSSSQNYTNGTIAIDNNGVRGNIVEINIRYVASNSGGSASPVDFKFNIKLVA